MRLTRLCETVCGERKCGSLRVTIAVVTRPVEIVAYRDDWPLQFETLAADLRCALGDVAIRIDHIGSTAVPGLPAKDVIDVQVTVRRLADVPAALAGYEHIPYHRDHDPPGPRLAEPELEKRLLRPLPPARAANVHLRVAGRFNHRYALLCRDYLRAVPAAAAAYAEVKRTLAARFPDDLELYSDVKDPVFDVIMAGAEYWADATGWQVPR
jgi:GrpB-like predicted nucleotidyltransferase (UPF0157 family)